MSKRIKNSGDSAPLVLPTNAGETYEEMMLDIPDFTPEQCAWLQAATLELEKDYAPTRSLVTGL
jgi:hypothetical protein